MNISAMSSKAMNTPAPGQPCRYRGNGEHGPDQDLARDEQEIYDPDIS
ncbi:hypothetical protein [Streptosporangium sp. KLBMP 9127]|nr:hypothetical protein [Streptosporangium sp. KLBMP 9127]